MTAQVPGPAHGLDDAQRDFDIDFDIPARVLKPYGELDTLTSFILLAAAKAFTEELPGDVTIDLADVTSGNQALVDALNDIRGDQQDQGYVVTIVNPRASMQRLFLLTGFRA